MKKFISGFIASFIALIILVAIICSFCYFTNHSINLLGISIVSLKHQAHLHQMHIDIIWWQVILYFSLISALLSAIIVFGKKFLNENS